jgi:molybdate transport system substrate-binding protein
LQAFIANLAQSGGWEGIMTTHRIIAALAGWGLLLLAAQAQAAEFKVSSSTALKTALEQLGPQFEKATGNKVFFTFAPAAVLKAQIDKGAAFDVAILPYL